MNNSCESGPGSNSFKIANLAQLVEHQSCTAGTKELYTMGLGLNPNRGKIPKQNCAGGDYTCF